MMDDDTQPQPKIKKKRSKKNYGMYVPVYPQCMAYPNQMMTQPQPMMAMTPQPQPMVAMAPQPVPMMQPIVKGAEGPIMAVPIGPPVTVAQPIGPPVMMAQPVPAQVVQPIPQPPPQPVVQKPKPKLKKPKTVIIRRYYREDDCCNIF